MDEFENENVETGLTLETVTTYVEEPTENPVEYSSEINDKLDTLIELLTPSSTEEITEELTEEITEEIPFEEQPVQKKDIAEVVEALEKTNNNLEGLSKGIDRVTDTNKEISDSLQVANSRSVASDEISLEYLGESSDHSLYFSDLTYGADLDDIYSMTLSIRNTCIILLLVLIIFFCLRWFRNAIAKIMNR